MNLDSCTLAVIDALSAEDIPFLVVGSYSTNVYGIPRSTKDADIVIDLGGKPLLSLNQHLPASLHLDPQMRLEREVDGRTVNIPTAEDVIVTKLRWAHRIARRKDLDDIRNVLAVRQGDFDWDYIHRWADEHGTRALLEEIRAEIPPLD